MSSSKIWTGIYQVSQFAAITFVCTVPFWMNPAMVKFEKWAKEPPTCQECRNNCSKCNKPTWK